MLALVLLGLLFPAARAASVLSGSCDACGPDAACYAGTCRTASVIAQMAFSVEKPCSSKTDCEEVSLLLLHCLSLPSLNHLKIIAESSQNRTLGLPYLK